MDVTADSIQPADVRAIGTADLNAALAEGWADFRAKRGDLLLLPLIYPAMGLIAATFAFNRDLFPLLFPLVGGFALVGPVAAAGFYEMAKRREAGEDPSWWHFLDPLNGPRRWPLLALTAGFGFLFIMWMICAQLIYEYTLGPLNSVTPAALFANLFTTPEGWSMVIVGNIVGAGFALIALGLSFAFPYVVDKAADPLSAAFTSLRVFQRNPMTTLRWGITVGLILFAAAIPLLIGLMVALPVLGYATWHLYTRAVVR
ncbi:DUF2189 domain-containing protein [Sandaracinobacteroides saxicola]|uniref:DUF2189 domain-containing protein n=1 Tax=Sandaracinobacteroides saxicola TaxID=2759707 RepID=A0A7G5IHT4_9SPHN|nr:DUF2189 domain-containing protein [Sandaracinobacteroides saxicola]QMW22926.1 DUF2189 domain-containing protein [Sandaracinobacteroides saxicola]